MCLWHHGRMVWELEITYVMELCRAVDHELQASGDVAITVPCAQCGRSGRTQIFGPEGGRCSGGRSLPAHPVRGGVRFIERADDGGSAALRVTLDLPELEAESSSSEDSLTTWSRLGLAYRCPRTGLVHEDSVQSNLGRPSVLRCQSCEAELATSREAPTVRARETG